MINLSWLLQDRTGEWHVVTFSGNNPDPTVDPEVFSALARRAIALAGPE